MCSHRRDNRKISNFSNRLLYEVLGFALIIIPGIFFCIVNNFYTVWQMTPSDCHILLQSENGLFIFLWHVRLRTPKTETHFRFQPFSAVHEIPFIFKD